MKEILLTFIVWLCIQLNLSAQSKDTLFIYDMPHQIFVENKKVQFDRYRSIKSRESFDAELKSYLSQYNYKSISDSIATINKTLNKEFETIFAKIKKAVPLSKITFSENLKAYIEATGCSKFIVFETRGTSLDFATYLNRGLRNSLITNVTGIPTFTNRASTSLNCLVIENNKIIHFASSEKLKDPLNKEIKSIMITKVMRKFMKKHKPL